MAEHAPPRLASEDVIINAPMSYAGSAQRIWRIRRNADADREQSKLAALTVLAVLLILVAWAVVTGWYLFWGLLLVPYRLLRRGARKRNAEALRHRELLGTIQGSAAASASAIVTSQFDANVNLRAAPAPTELIADTDREDVIQELAQHLVAGRLTTPEFEDRMSTAHAARTRLELDSARANLPSGAQGPGL